MTKAKPQPHFADHVRYGHGEILSVRELDSGGGILAAVVRFADGTERCIRLSRRAEFPKRPEPLALAHRRSRADAAKAAETRKEESRSR